MSNTKQSDSGPSSVAFRAPCPGPKSGRGDHGAGVGPELDV